MTKSFRVYTEVRAETEDAAIAMVTTSAGLIFRAHDQGFVHPDGQVRRCAPAPEGHVVYQYDEFVEEDGYTQTLYLALVTGTILELSPEGRLIAPNGSMIWHRNRWEKFGHRLALTK